MKFSPLAVLPLAGLFGQALASPVVVPVEALEKRQDIDIVVDLENLLVDIQIHTSNINATLDGIPQSVPALMGKAVGAAIIRGEITAIVELLNNATDALGIPKVVKRQDDVGADADADADADAGADADADAGADADADAGADAGADADAVTTIVELILSDISGTIANIESTLGLGAFLDALTPLGPALTDLVTSVGGVVDQVLDLVKQLSDGVFQGLTGIIGGLELGL